MYKFGFIGAGNMGSAIARGMCKTVNPSDIAVCDTDAAKVNSLSSETGITVTDIKDISVNSRYIILAVKPQALPSVLGTVKDFIVGRDDRFVFVSMAAGTAVSKIKNLLDTDVPVIRIMPNVPCSVGAGMTLCAPDESITEEELKTFISAYEGCGAIDVIEESKIDAYSIVTGCGPAFAYLMIEALADGQVEIGVPRDKAYLYAAKMIEGSAKLMTESGRIPADLKDSVCSPGGTTIEGVRVLENGAFRSSVIEAVRASYKRTLELGK
ncbi:MAG: pyrroline-5-carboxylate reductase [Clostridia bacterium]|nr:pyrroline-5-carboxylate reductase [Clostridia bacterium]